MSLIPFNFYPDIEGIDRYLQEDDDDPAVNYEGRLNNSNWCSCGYCKGMLSDIDCLCCNELPNLEKIREQEGKCITLHRSFSKLILVHLLKRTGELSRLGNLCVPLLLLQPNTLQYGIIFFKC
ncbi:unnamed protein product [Macrosiphum euphorbiae]|uniref:P2X purinoreceptor 7 intracellular domain-containing protein n=1 Tax=Macrosiphum euphorbiae TaxID=13131 RepID=A0AAV0WB32_9HEMI|nr:unnamed protein product [Macrosiphum euphorbiae]